MYHSCCDDIRGLFAMGGHHEDSRGRQGAIILVQSFVELNKFYHKAVVWTGDASFLFDELFSFFIIVAELKY